MTSFRRLILLRRRSCLSFCFLFPSVSWAYGRVLFGFLNHLLLMVKVGCIYSSCDVTYGLKLLVLDIAPVPNASYGMSSSLPSLEQAISSELFGSNPSPGHWD